MGNASLIEHCGASPARVLERRAMRRFHLALGVSDAEASAPSVMWTEFSGSAFRPVSRRRRFHRPGPRWTTNRRHVARFLFGEKQKCRQLSQASAARRTI